MAIPKLLTPKMLVEVGVAASEMALAQMRHKGTGPVFLKLSDSQSGRVVYEEHEVVKWLNSRRMTRTDQRG